MATGGEDWKELVAQFEAEGTALGKDGATLKKFVEDCCRDERLAARNAAREKVLALELKDREIAFQKDVENKRFQLEDKRLSEAKKQKEEELKHRAEKKKMMNRPKLPYFDEKTDEVESYLYRFEKHAAIQEWTDDDKGSILPSLLRGRALNYYQELAVEDANNYKKLSDHLLRRFRCTEEGFRTQFRSVKPDSGENMNVFFSRMKRHFQRWLELSGVGSDFAKLSDLFLRERILASCSGQLVTFLKEDKHARAESMI